MNLSVHIFNSESLSQTFKNNLVMNLVLNLFQYWSSICYRPKGEILKRPMKRVQGVVQDDSSRKC
jgi:hypothetical protein